jgi:hypothetical protein
MVSNLLYRRALLAEKIETVFSRRSLHMFEEFDREWTPIPWKDTSSGSTTTLVCPVRSATQAEKLKRLFRNSTGLFHES